MMRARGWFVLGVLSCAPLVFAEDASSVRQEIFRRLSDGKNALELGDARAAAQDLCWAARRALNSHDAAWLCGRALLLLHRPEDAVKALRVATDIDPIHLGSWIDLGNALLAAGRPNDARPAFYKALDIRKDYSPAWDGLARLAAQTGKNDEALQLFGKALEANPADARARLHRGQLHLKAGRLEQAIADIAEAARLRPDDGDVQLGLARVQLLARQPDLALAAVKRAAEVLKKDARVPALTAEIFLATGALTEAADAAKTALALDPDQGRARLVLGEVLGRGGRLEEAIAQLSPPDPSVLEEQDLAALTEARARWKTRLDERNRLETVAMRDDAPAEELLQLSEIRLETGNLPGATSLALRAGKGATDPAIARRAAVVLGRAGHPTVAQELLAPVAAGPSATPADQVNLGVMREETGDLDGALQAYRLALTMAGPAGAAAIAADAHAGLARVAYAKGDRAGAASELRAYLDSNPPAEYAARAKIALERLAPSASEVKK